MRSRSCLHLVAVEFHSCFYQILMSYNSWLSAQTHTRIHTAHTLVRADIITESLIHVVLEDHT